MKSTKTQALRFLIAGCVNTGLTYLIYLIALNFFGYTAAFSISFVIGIFVAFILNSWFVFSAPVLWQKLLQYPFIYLVQYVVGLLLLTALVEKLQLDERVAPIVNVVILVPITFALNRWFILRNSSNGSKKY